MDAKIKFIPFTRVLSDETRSYKISFVGMMSIDDFVVNVLKERSCEYGCFYYKDFSEENMIVEYKNGKITFLSERYNQIKNQPVLVAISHGGWSMMDYLINKKRSIPTWINYIKEMLCEKGER